MKMLTVKQYLSIISIVLSVILTAYMTSMYYKLKISRTETAYQKERTALVEAQKKVSDLNNQLNVKLKEQERVDYEKYSKLQDENENLRADVANGTRKLRIKIASCSSTSAEAGTSSLGNGTTTSAVIDAGYAESIISITKKADKYKSQLEALQNYIKEYNMVIDKQKEEIKK